MTATAHTTRTVASVLRHAADLVDSGWSARAAARDQHQQPVDPDAWSAACWSAGGAIMAACSRSGVVDEGLEAAALAVLAQVVHPGHQITDRAAVRGWNDAMGLLSQTVPGKRDVVIAAMREAAERAA